VAPRATRSSVYEIVPGEGFVGAAFRHRTSRANEPSCSCTRRPEFEQAQVAPERSPFVQP
jgi:hypothetical protein